MVEALWYCVPSSMASGRRSKSATPATDPASAIRSTFISRQAKLLQQEVYRGLECRVRVRALDDLRADDKRRRCVDAGLLRFGPIGVYERLIRTRVCLHISGDLRRVNALNFRIQFVYGCRIAEPSVFCVLRLVHRDAPREVCVRIELPDRTVVESGRR